VVVYSPSWCVGKKSLTCVKASTGLDSTTCTKGELVASMLRAKDPKVRRARVCIMVAGLVLQGIAGSEHWPLDALV